MSNWLEVLTKECQTKTQVQVANLLGCSNSAISQVLKGTYPANPVKLERSVLSVFCGQVVDSPSPKKRYVQPPKKVETPFLLAIIDFIFCRHIVSTEDLKSTFTRNKVDKALGKLTKRDLLLVHEQPRKMKGRPHKFYRLRCDCPAPGLMPNCSQCPLGSLILKLDKDIPQEVGDDDC